jgi:5-methylcytosine-specific restriction endonuclease McrA
MSDPRYSSQRWRKMRRRFLDQHPLCKFCKQKGLIRAATVVDHVIPHKGDAVKFWSGELQALCKPCHDGDKQHMEKTGAEAPRIAKDCDVNGRPTDPRHPWNQ